MVNKVLCEVLPRPDHHPELDTPS